MEAEAGGGWRGVPKPSTTTANKHRRKTLPVSKIDRCYTPRPCVRGVGSDGVGVAVGVGGRSVYATASKYDSSSLSHVSHTPIDEEENSASSKAHE